jgi:Leucine-rich repeat (LRR) protein
VQIPIYGNLAYLYLEGNTIETLPEELAGFTKLQLLSVSQNRCV